jgi:hypothetical protein
VFPLALDFAADSIEVTLAVVQAKVLVKAAELHREMLLLFPASPMPMFCQPLMGLRKELSAALQARETDHGEASVPGFATHVLEAKKLKSLWPFRDQSPCGGAAKRSKASSRVLSSASSRLNRRSRSCR